MPELVSKEFVIIWVSSVESELRNVISIYKKVQKYTAEKSNSNKLLKELMDEIEEISDGKVSLKNKFWKELDFIRIIRNHIVHNDSFLEKEFSNDFKKYIVSQNIVYVDEELRPNLKFCNQIMVAYDNLFTNLLDLLFDQEIE